MKTTVLCLGTAYLMALLDVGHLLSCHFLIPLFATLRCFNTFFHTQYYWYVCHLFLFSSARCCKEDVLISYYFYWNCGWFWKCFLPSRKYFHKNLWIHLEMFPIYFSALNAKIVFSRFSHFFLKGLTLNLYENSCNGILWIHFFPKSA